ncbi:MAG: thiamine pyrophosphate-requiring protein [Candidatus Eremiobacteraeota bacterium]|nr:thiamine pyrophosphate-requiring protein [Candidatus Eremiobacteraeota bacterium]MBC5801791.1 thiamine pyrophosphate-requiring protein [Candidatus Eremiobacteraeota bacterium]MBC5823143.1 thiamine pyrophosphate-requiring protein [Candidatus Eremiobacteraeota bacterium]
MKRLMEWGIHRIYGYPGDGINGLISAIAATDGGIELIQVRHEEMAAFMACAHAKYTGELGVCIATSGPGAIHLLNGLYDAKLDHVPVLAIVGQAATMSMGGDFQQEIDLSVLFKDVASAYLVTVSNPVQVRQAVDRAVRIAKATRSVTTIVVPKDVQEMKAVESPPHAKMYAIHTGIGYSAPRIVPEDVDLRRAADVLNAGNKIAMLVGAGAKDAVDEVIAVADALQAGAAKALLGKDVLPDDLPWVTGCLGLLGTRPSSDMMKTCDTLFMIGSTYPYGNFLPKEGQARGVQIDINARYLGLRYPMEVNLCGDSKATLKALLPLLQKKTDTTWRENLRANREEWYQVDAARADVSADPLNPELLFTQLSPRLPDNCILSGDAGTATNWLARHLMMRRGMKFSLSGTLATMGPAVPYAIAAKFAFPDRVAIALTGDGAMQMNGNAELITVAKYWKRWSDPRLIFLVLNNRDLNQVTWELRIETGDPKFPGSQDLPDFPYARYAELIGLRGIRVDKPSDVGPAWDAALSADRPVVLEAYVDANVSIIPPHITSEYARNFANALITGDPDEKGIIIESVKSVVAGLIPGHKGAKPGGAGAGPTE